MKKKILMASLDLEQKFHRGIASWAKMVIRTLSENYDIYLLTSAKYNKGKVDLIKNIINNLNNPQKLNSRRKSLFLYLKYILLKSKGRIIENIPPSEGIFEGKLYFLNFTKGFLNIPNFYEILSVNTVLRPKSALNININSHDFNLIITSSPMAIKTANIPIIQTLHDVIPLTCSNVEDRADIFYLTLKTSLENSEKVICVSNFSKEECLRFFPQYEKKLEVTYQPVPIYKEEKQFAENPIVQDSILSKFKIKKGEFLLYIGVLEKRKNIKRMIEAFLAIHKKLKIPLVIAGGPGYGWEEFKNLLFDFPNKIKYLGYISNLEKLVLLKTARAFIFPSLTEGFGLPPLEAMLMGTPVLTSNRGALPEVCDKAALYVDPYRIDEIAEGILEITTNESLRERLIKEGYKRTKFFSNENFKKNLYKVIREVI